MELNNKVTQLEDEIKILKNEVQAVLLDIRESYLNRENPFNSGMSPMSTQPIIINQMPSTIEREPHEAAPPESQEPELPAEEEPASEPELIQEPELTGEPEFAIEAEPVTQSVFAHKPKVFAGEETFHEEAKKEWRAEIASESRLKSPETTIGSDGKIDLATITTITTLAQWVDITVNRMGHEKTKSILNISETMGCIIPAVKDILVKFIGPMADECLGKTTILDYLVSIVELNSLLGRSDSDKSEAAILSILCKEEKP